MRRYEGAQPCGLADRRVVGFISKRPLVFPFLPNVPYPIYIQANCCDLSPDRQNLLPSPQ